MGEGESEEWVGTEGKILGTIRRFIIATNKDRAVCRQRRVFYHH